MVRLIGARPMRCKCRQRHPSCHSFIHLFIIVDTRCSKETTAAAAIEAMFACINPQVLDNVTLTGMVSRALHEVAAAKTATTARSLRSTFAGLQSMFDRIRRHERTVSLDRAAIADVKTLLFGAPVSIESIRVMRAQAVLASVTCVPNLKQEMEGDVGALMADEVSVEVRQILDSAVQRP